jgi:hypothetical protein
VIVVDISVELGRGETLCSDCYLLCTPYVEKNLELRIVIVLGVMDVLERKHGVGVTKCYEKL